MQTQPWIHITAKLPDGEGESWLSPWHRVAGASHPHGVSFEDYRQNICYRYDAKQGLLLRRELSPQQREGFECMVRLFEAILLDEPTLQTSLPDMEVIDQTRQSISEQGRGWIQYDLTLRDKTRQRGMLRISIRVDPETRLASSMQMTDVDRQPPVTADLVFDYPAEGPVDIYALGVPRSTKVEDYLPSGEVEELLDRINSSRARFEDYQAYALDGFFERGRLPNVHRIYRKGACWRWEFGETGPNFKWPTPPGADTDMMAYLKEYSKQLRFKASEVCDGKSLYHRKLGDGSSDEAAGPEWEAKAAFRPDQPVDRQSSFAGVNASRHMPELYAYPSLRSYYFATRLETKPSEDPPGILLHDGGTHRYWVDPQRGCAVVRQEVTVFTDSQAKTTEPAPRVTTMEEWKQTPSGIWYPTLVKTPYFGSVRFYLDFEAELPDSLFEPSDQAAAA